MDFNEVVFPRLGIHLKVNDTAFTLFGLEIKWYGLIIATGILLSLIYGFSQMKKYGIDPDRAVDAVIAGIIGALIGARAYYVIIQWKYYSGNLLSIFNLRNGGLAIYGGIIGGLLLGGMVAKFRKLKLLPLLDVTGICLLLGQGIGRWGNFTNQEAFGYNTEGLFGMTSEKISSWIHTMRSSADAGEDILAMNPDIPVHPCFLYESAWCLLGFLLLALLAKKIRKYDGQIFLIYIAWYGLGRFFIEGLRTDSLKIGTVRVSQALAAICVITSVILLITVGSKVKRMGSDYVFYKDTEESKELIRLSELRAQGGGSDETDEPNDGTEGDTISINEELSEKSVEELPDNTDKIQTESEEE